MTASTRGPDGGEVRARKAHECVHCAGEIAAGERYVSVRIRPWDHPVNEHYWQYRACLRCERYWQAEGADISENYMWCDPIEWLTYRTEWETKTSQLIASPPKQQLTDHIRSDRSEG